MSSPMRAPNKVAKAEKLPEFLSQFYSGQSGEINLTGFFKILVIDFVLFRCFLIESDRLKI